MVTIIPNTFIHIPGWLPKAEADTLFPALESETLSRCQMQLTYGAKGPWRNKAKRMGRFGDPGVTYDYNGKPKPIYPWTPSLLTIKALVEGHLDQHGPKETFNCGVVNAYLNETADLYPHTDITYLPQLGQEPVIAAVSLGEVRDFILRPMQASKPVGKNDIIVPLGHGDLFIMCGRSQLDWKHGLKACPTSKGLRLSVTFRHHLS